MRLCSLHCSLLLPKQEYEHFSLEILHLVYAMSSVKATEQSLGVAGKYILINSTKFV